MFWGWGEPGAGPELPEHAARFLRDELGVSGEVVSPPVALEDVRLREPALPAGLRARLAGAVGEEGVRDDREARVLRCRGKSYLDLLAQRAGECSEAPDAVVAPADAGGLRAVLEACADAAVAVVPFGGGTSVVGGVEPVRGGFEAAISLDLGRMDRLVGVDERSLIAVLEPGIRLPEADRALAAHGLRLAHVPQSYEWATVGGCVATRSAGQSSTGHGRIDANVVAVELVTPAGDLATLGLAPRGDGPAMGDPVTAPPAGVAGPYRSAFVTSPPASAAGPSLRELVVGSEGSLGVIARVALRVRPVAATTRFDGWFARSFADGCEALRRLAQAGAAPDLARLSDEDETRVGLALAGPGGRGRRAGLGLLRAGGYRAGCLLVAGWEGEEREIAARRRRAVRILRSAGAFPLGRGPGEAWAAARFAGPHLRDDLLDRGVLVETLETATSWSNLGRLYAAVREAVAGALPGAVVGCHVSHLYPTGGSLYFTVLSAQDPADPGGQWRAAKAAATDAIVAAGGTITHHHAIGRDHAPWLPDEAGALGIDLLRAAKERCDPDGIMNPGKLLALY